MIDQSTCPCKTCSYRKLLAYLDFHIWGDDCDFVCEKYNTWKAESKTIEG